MTTTPKLLPCPFCGSQADTDSGIDPLSRRVELTLHWVECKKLLCATKGKKAYNPQEAIDFWNRRAEVIK